MKWQGISSLSALFLLSSVPALGQSAPNPAHQSATANLTVTATVVASVGIVFTPKGRSRLVTANVHVSNVYLPDDTKMTTTYSLASQGTQVSVLEETHSANVMLAGKIVRRQVMTITIIPQ